MGYIVTTACRWKVARINSWYNFQADEILCLACDQPAHGAGEEKSLCI